jgi:hypothetical protein
LTKQSDWINAKYKDRIKIYDIEGLIWKILVIKLLNKMS